MALDGNVLSCFLSTSAASQEVLDTIYRLQWSQLSKFTCLGLGPKRYKPNGFCYFGIWYVRTQTRALRPKHATSKKSLSKDNCVSDKSSAGFQIGFCRSLDIAGLDLGVFSDRVHPDPRVIQESQRDYRLLP